MTKHEWNAVALLGCCGGCGAAVTAEAIARCGDAALVACVLLACFTAILLIAHLLKMAFRRMAERALWRRVDRRMRRERAAGIKAASARVDAMTDAQRDAAALKALEGGSNG